MKVLCSDTRCDIRYAPYRCLWTGVDNNNDYCGENWSTRHDDGVGLDTGRDRGAGGRGGGRGGEDRAGHESAGGADRRDRWGEDGTPNSHDDLHASTEVSS